MNYKSSIRLLGLPLVHVAIGPPEGSSGVRGIAKGWIAIGDIAFGVVFALGGLAVGGVSVGGLSVGVLALAGLSAGIWSVGGLALGVFALGGGAIAVWAANGGLAVASEYSLGGVAIGSHANTDAARAYFESSWFSVLPHCSRAIRAGCWCSRSLFPSLRSSSNAEASVPPDRAMNVALSAPDSVHAESLCFGCRLLSHYAPIMSSEE